jgi:hypothetical protein
VGHGEEVGARRGVGARGWMKGRQLRGRSRVAAARLDGILGGAS